MYEEDTSKYFSPTLIWFGLMVSRFRSCSSCTALFEDDNLKILDITPEFRWFTVISTGQPYCWYFCLNLKYLGWPHRAYIKTAKNGGFCEELLSDNNFEAVLATFCGCNYNANASEAGQKIATDHKCSSCVIICWIAKISLSMNNNEKRLATRTPPT